MYMYVVTVKSLLFCCVCFTGITGNRNCPWACADGTCLDDSYKRCDSRQDCRDNSDEIGCDLIGCHGYTRFCNSSMTCVNKEVQCSDGKCEDERKWFSCSKSDKCIPRWGRCNGLIDCGDDDNSDEATCLLSECDEYTGYCNASMQCLSLSDRCPDGSCPGDRYLCRDGLRCLSHTSRCDGRQDCYDSSDEDGCTLQDCYYKERQYCDSTKKCLPYGQLCDGNADCPDATDETSCGPEDCRGYAEYCNSTKSCGDSRKKCPDGTCADDRKIPCKMDDACIFASYRCDGRRHCADGSDEQNCTREECENSRSSDMKHCPGLNICKKKDKKCGDVGEVQCDDDRWPCPEEDKCIRRRDRCNGLRERGPWSSAGCRDGSDEVNCTAADCGSERYFCAPKGVCYSKSSSWCDGKIDCDDKSDESSCGPRDCQLHSRYCASQKVRKCVLNDRKCSDGTCLDTWFACPNGRKCIPESERCDGKPDCGSFRRDGGADELECSAKDCKGNTRFCASSMTCVDRDVKCSDGTCGEDRWGQKYFACSRSSECIHAAFRCDGRRSCRHGDDEQGCKPEDCQSLVWEMRYCNDTETCVPKRDKCLDGSCVAGMVPCAQGDRCVHLRNVCDGSRHCWDGSDEENCKN